MGTGLRPNRPPGEWEKRPLPMTGAQADGPQGPSVLRSLGTPQGCFPSQVVDVLADSPGGFLTQILAGRPGMELERNKPGDDTNTSGPVSGFPGSFMPKGSASKVTGTPTMGSTSGKGTI